MKTPRIGTCPAADSIKPKAPSMVAGVSTAPRASYRKRTPRQSKRRRAKARPTASQEKSPCTVLWVGSGATPARTSAIWASSAPSRRSALLNQGNSVWRRWLSACTAQRLSSCWSKRSHGGRETRRPKGKGTVGSGGESEGSATDPGPSVTRGGIVGRGGLGAGAPLVLCGGEG